MTVQALLRANPQITNPDLLQVGQPICIPPGLRPQCPGFLYRIAAGDTLFALAQRFGLTVQEILRANPGIDPDRLAIGQEICIPTGVPAIRRCLLMNPTDIAPNVQAVAFLNQVRPLVMVTNVPRPEQLPGGEVYKVYVGRMASDEFAVETMTEGLPGVWIGRRPDGRLPLHGIAVALSRTRPAQSSLANLTPSATAPRPAMTFSPRFPKAGSAAPSCTRRMVS